MARPGGTVRSVTVPPQSALEVHRGEIVWIVDVEGRQVGDLWVIDADDHSRWLSTSHTRDRIERLFPWVGEAFTDQVGVPILALVTDTSPGVHDMLFPPCDRWLYESAGRFDHPNCLHNFISAAASMGISLPVVPDPVNVFQNSRPQSDGTLSVLAAASEPGDAICFRALRDVVVVLTWCSVDNSPTNNFRCTALQTLCLVPGRYWAATPPPRSTAPRTEQAAV
jgi:uncharacterized protein YcgI (DUF1989 family)